MPKSIDPFSEELPKNIHTLSSFIDENHKLLTSLGVFIALTVFSSNLPLIGLSYFLSFLFLSGAVIIWLETWQKFPKGNATWLLFIFENILSLITVVIILYWFFEFRKIWHGAVFGIILILLLSLFSVFMKRYNIFNRLLHTEHGKLKIVRIIFGILVILTFISLAFILASATSPSVDRILELVFETLLTPVP